jgi:hypothetical protein
LYLTINNSSYNNLSIIYPIFLLKINFQIFSVSLRIKLYNLEQANLTLPKNLKYSLVWLFLGDLCLHKRTKNGNTRLMLEQRILHKEYIYHFYVLLKDYCHFESHISKQKNQIIELVNCILE